MAQVKFTQVGQTTNFFRDGPYMTSIIVILSEKQRLSCNVTSIYVHTAEIVIIEVKVN